MGNNKRVQGRPRKWVLQKYGCSNSGHSEPIPDSVTARQEGKYCRERCDQSRCLGFYMSKYGFRNYEHGNTEGKMRCYFTERNTYAHFDGVWVPLEEVPKGKRTKPCPDALSEDICCRVR